MWFATAGVTEEPRHARVEPRPRRSYTGVFVVLVYVLAIGLNEWRLQRHVDSVRARQTTQVVVELPVDPGGTASGQVRAQPAP